jgi:predicted nucleic acid-binding protein
MIVIADATALIALGRISRLAILKELFGVVHIPDSVYQETVLESNIEVQRNSIAEAVNDFLKVVRPSAEITVTRNLGKGEVGVLRLAREMGADLLIIDDRKAANEASALGFSVARTANVLKLAEQRGLIPSYAEIVSQLGAIGIFLPE